MSDREQRIVALQTRLADFLAAPVGDGYGYPTVSEEEFAELDDIIGEIADLKYKRDCDGDQVLTWELASRKEGRLIAEVVPHHPDRDDEHETEADYELRRDRTRIKILTAAERLMGAAGELMRPTLIQIDDELRDVEASRAGKVRKLRP